MDFPKIIQITQHLLQKNMALRNLAIDVQIVKLVSAIALAAGVLLFSYGICSALFHIEQEYKGTLFGTKIKQIIKGALLITYSAWAFKICNTISTADVFYHRLWILGLAIFTGGFLALIIPVIIKKVLENKERNQKA